MDVLPQDLINLITLKDATVIGILVSLLFWGYSHFSKALEKLEKRLEEKDEEIKRLIEKYDDKIKDIRDKYDDELKALRREQSVIIEKISTLISENTRILQDVSLELSIKRRKDERN